MVHEMFDAKKIVQLQARNPAAQIIAHPECPESVLDIADHIGSTSSLLNYTKTADVDEFIVVTEAGIIHQMQKASPQKKFHATPNSETCNCAECPFMRLSSLEKIYLNLRDETPEILVPEAIQQRALEPLERMLALS